MRRYLVPILSLALASIAIWNYVDDLNARKPIQETASRFTIDIRRPIEHEMIRHAPSADFAALVLASSALGDALGTKRLTNLSPVERRAWLDVPVDLDDELAAAIEQELVAIRRNPGWPLHRYFLGKLAYTRDRRSLGGESEPDKWLPLLVSAWRSAPHHEQSTETLAGVLLEANRLLGDEHRALTPAVLESALRDPGFVRVAFDIAVGVVGRDAAFAALPNEPRALLEAARALGRSGHLSGAIELFERWEVSEREARTADLATMRTRLERGDLLGLLSAASAWAGAHDPAAFDDLESSEQLEDVLRLWPRDQVGSWTRDPRGAIARHFLDKRLNRIDASVLEGTVSTLANVPPPVRARVALAAGNRAKAESLVKGAGSEGAFEWTDTFVDLARLELARNDLEGAIAAIGRISPSARGECDVVVVRRQAGEELDAPAIAVTNSDGTVVDEAWSSNGMLGICVDPMTAAGRTLEITFESAGGAIVEWGLNATRRDTILVEGARTIDLPLDGLFGRNVVYTKVLWGDAELKRTARVK